ncbi:MAG TPA: DUF4384 domain-containing protein [Syntrophales bacterium]|mgnify:CR=1 FL=1|nr:DUF4384 domain-containing protein [Syntrophales bacterium]HOM08173.1 DUF4384 domain-containing protein [Syntrophales bacterium]HON99209.1 DUF4384 domain-containing protein [Syntrophales bacterium]HPC00317.1 DUF4384 domain-containing protein [Syntrophales bacterium]HPQ05979.1 DUF4384 domain-containing protein [Syntrophales bacterium]
MGDSKGVIVSLLVLSALTLAAPLWASQSSIVAAEGYACLGEDRTKRQTEEAALQDAKRKAVEQVATYIRAETEIKDLELKKDLVNAYAHAKVRVLESKGRWDSEPPKIGDCHRLQIKAEVVPDEEAIKRLTQTKDPADPSAPLAVQVWTDKKEYRAGERVRIFLKGNKPFYARIVYRQADGGLIQLLPNPYRKENYFQGGVVYEIPSGPDRFDLEVAPPFGEEDIVVYAGTGELGDLDLETSGGVYRVKTRSAHVGDKTRGLKVVGKGQAAAAEFMEGKVTIRTR